MQTIFLRFPGVAEALAAFGVITGDDAGALDEVPSVVVVDGLRIDVDVIGLLRHDTGRIDADGWAVTEPVDGFHVNLWVPDTAVLPVLLASAIVHPVTPARTFG